jgi:hypothetical protein
VRKESSRIDSVIINYKMGYSDNLYIDGIVFYMKMFMLISNVRKEKL